MCGKAFDPCIFAFIGTGRRMFWQTQSKQDRCSAAEGLVEKKAIPTWMHVERTVEDLNVVTGSWREPKYSGWTPNVCRFSIAPIFSDRKLGAKMPDMHLVYCISA